MGLFCGAEVFLHSKMELNSTELEPASAPGCKLRRLGELYQIQNPRIKGPRGVLSAYRNGALDMIERRNH